jgi:phospholipase C
MLPVQPRSHAMPLNTFVARLRMQFLTSHSPLRGPIVLGSLALVASVAIGMPTLLGSLAATAAPADTTTPIKHVVVIYQENNSFDHYFATYPIAQNPAGEPAFRPAPDTPSVNGLNDSLLAPNNPNTSQPFRLDRSQAVTCDQDHGYTDEQKAYDAGLMDKFPDLLGVANTIKVGVPPNTSSVACDYGHGKGLEMGYFDGNTVTALWNYAQKFAMSDNFYETTFGPSTPGNVNLISGQTHGFTPDDNAVTVNDTIIGDPQPTGDICSTRDTSMQLPASTDKNIGDLLNAKNVTWGWFQGGFREASGTSAVTGQPTTNTPP